MIKIDISVKKRSQPTIFDQFLQKKLTKGQIKPNQNQEEKIAQTYNSKEFQNKQNWNKKQEENLIMLLQQSIIQQPYLQFDWAIYQQSFYLAKICKKLQRSEKSLTAKLEEIKSVHEQNYSKLDIVEFLTVYWKLKNFKSEEGRQKVKKIKLLRKKSSDHMKMCDQIMNNLTQKQDSFQSLYDLIMKN